MPKGAADYGSRYTGDYGYDHLHDWNIVQERIRTPENRLQAFNDMIYLDGDVPNPHGAMEHAVEALTAANGAHYSQVHPVNILMNEALEAGPQFDFTPAPGGSIYRQYRGAGECYLPQSPIPRIEGRREMVNRDVQTILDRAREVMELRDNQ